MTFENGKTVKASPAGSRLSSGTVTGLVDEMFPGVDYHDLGPAEMDALAQELKNRAVGPTPVASPISTQLEGQAHGGLARKRRSSPYLNQMQRRSINRAAVLNSLR
jgi:hypothetical protein